jgi:hypothetical protein
VASMRGTRALARRLFSGKQKHYFVGWAKAATAFAMSRVHSFRRAHADLLTQHRVGTAERTRTKNNKRPGRLSPPYKVGSQPALSSRIAASRSNR